MGTLRAITAALALIITQPIDAESVAGWRAFVAEASARFDVPVAWIERVMQAESAGKTRLAGRPITSRAGAMGLMQLMPVTWAAMRATYNLGADPYDPHDNILAGTAYLRAMYDRFGYPGMFAAYNAGPARYAAYLAGRASLPDETRAYLAAVSETGLPRSAGRIARPPASVFVALSDTAPPLNPASAPTRPPGLFVVLSPR